jgi:anti-sigma B factor antagonist
MPSPVRPFAAEVLHQDGSLVLRLTGELDVLAAPSFRQTVADLVSPHLRTVTLDLGGLDFADLAGLRSIREAMWTVAAANAEFKLRGASELVLRVIHLADLDDLLDAVESAN